MQQTVDITRETLDFDEPDEDDPNEGEGQESNVGDADSETAIAAQKAKEQEEAEQLAKQIAAALSEEILEGQIELLAKGAYVVIRIREKGSFASASDTIEPQFIPVIRKIEGILKDTIGEIRVAGHTDNLPINNEYFKSNWELSGGRAGSVTRELLGNGILEKNRFVITGYADTKPIADNSSREGRATNRRVEIIIVQGEMGTEDVVGVGIDTPTDN